MTTPAPRKGPSPLVQIRRNRIATDLERLKELSGCRVESDLIHLAIARLRRDVEAVQNVPHQLEAVLTPPAPPPSPPAVPKSLLQRTGS
jgi:hypothetical protein